jgi:hypothetical protein
MAFCYILSLPHLYLSRIFSTMDEDIQLKFDIWLVSVYLKITFGFLSPGCNFNWIMPLYELQASFFLTFLLNGLRYVAEIYYDFKLAWSVTDQVWESLRLTYFWLNYAPWWIKRVSFPDFLPYWMKIFSRNWCMASSWIIQIKSFRFVKAWLIFSWIIMQVGNFVLLAI